jgi:hypothetical protein
MDHYNHKSVNNDSGLDNEYDLDEVEISDIPSIEEDGTVYRLGISSQFVKLGARLPKRRHTWRWLMGIATCSLLLGLLLSNLPALKSGVLGLLPAPTPASVSYNSISIIIPDTTPNPQGNVDQDPDAEWAGQGLPSSTISAPVPQDCLSGPAVNSSHEVGRSPVWLYGFDGPQPTIHLRGFSQPIAHNVYGWPVLIQLMVKDNFTLPVTLRGGNLRDGPTIFFAFYPGERPMDTIILGTQESVVNPIHPQAGQKAAWITTMLLFGAGCYYLKATWPGGQWTINFAAGR